MGSTSLCRNCGGPTVRAHLIPSAFVRDLKGTAKHIYVGQAKRDGRRISQSGLIDNGILCGPCDRILGEYDNFGVEFCRTFATRAQFPADAIFLISPADTEKVVKFFASLIYRYSLSSLQEAARVNLGSFEDSFRDILFRGASCASEPATVLFRYRAWVSSAREHFIFLAGLEGDVQTARGRQEMLSLI
jgi:hypothetical protein